MSRKTFAFIVVAAMLLAVPVLVTGGAITRGNWGSSVGFAVDKNPAGFQPNQVIDASNIGPVEKLLPPSIVLLAKKYKYKLWTKNYEAYVPSNSYIAATNKYLGQPQAIDVGASARKKGLKSYNAGLPFPNPKNGYEVSWNYTYNYLGDDAANEFGVYWINAKRGVERSEEWTWDYIARSMFRTDIAPKPHIPEAAAKNIQYYSMTTCLKPFDKKGFTALYWRYVEPKDQDGYIYNPAQRRPIRFSFGTRGDAWNNTDLLYEDVRGYMGYPEWMKWKILAKGTFLAPMNSEIPHGRQAVKQVFDFDNAPYWNFKAKYEPRPMYVLEVIPKFRDYPYSKMIFYVDAESYFILYKEAYDKKGQLWKILINAWNKSPNAASQPADIGTSVVIDLQGEHATAFGWFKSKVNVGLKPSQFTLANLRKNAR
ncbi:MAG: DUF1329 domain-containing protein [Candidatus Lernaella stagnicola]|nr:DUF1329 domain-containing protein [Candidatus Lernaella stagnicola]